MTMHHVLCIHGLGKHENDWVDSKNDLDQSFKELFNELWDEYAPSTEKFADNVTLHPIHYDDEINKIFASWEEQVKKLKEGLSSSPMLKDEASWYTDAIDKASEYEEQNEWQYTHLLDLLLFVGSPSIQDRLIAYVGDQILELIKKHNEHDHISLIGHSMGTAMAHKAVQAIFNESTGHSSGQTIRGHFSFQSVAMVANTSYTLSRDKADFYKGIFRPSLSVGEGCCDKWFNVNHRIDPVGQFLPFDYKADPNWLDPDTHALGWHNDIELNKLTSKNIHSINHYFRDPLFHLPYFEQTFGIDISPQKKQKAIENHTQKSLQGNFKTLKSHLEALDVSNDQSFKDFYSSLKDFKALIKSFD